MSILKEYRIDGRVHYEFDYTVKDNGDLVRPSLFGYYHTLNVDPVNGMKTIKNVWVEGSPMPDTYMNGRPVYFGDVEGKFVDSFFASASWADTDEDLDDNELDQLTEENQDYLCEYNLETYGYWED